MGGSGARGRTGSQWSWGRGAETARAAVGSGRKAAPEAWCVGISTTGTRARDRGGCVTARSLTRGGRAVRGEGGREEAEPRRVVAPGASSAALSRVGGVRPSRGAQRPLRGRARRGETAWEPAR